MKIKVAVLSAAVLSFLAFATYYVCEGSMPVSYRQFRARNIDLGPLGIMTVRDAERAFHYPCTPKGARVFGDVGVDGIHYCFVRGFDETVFAVCPMSFGDEVHPVARSFTDFLRLILACGSAAALDQVHAWDEGQFDAYLAEYPPTDEERALLDEIREKMRLTPMERPFDYIRALQTSFDYGRICYGREYYANLPDERELPPWNVYFGGGFWEREGRGRPGEEIPVRRTFTWDGMNFYIPAVYSCAKGLVADICMEVPARDIEAFAEKGLSFYGDDADSTYDRLMRTRAEDPMAAEFEPGFVLNGKLLEYTGAFFLSWNPCAPEGDSLRERALLERYGLDPANGWVVRRCSFRWGRLRRPKIRSLDLFLASGHITLPGPKFRASAPGESVTFIHPKTGEEHTLTVLERERDEISAKDFECMMNDDLEYPGHYSAISYALSPGLPADEFSVFDSVIGDNPRQRRIDRNAPQSASGHEMAAGSVGIVGGADGPTAIFLYGPSSETSCVACSALRFDPLHDVEWQMAFHEKARPDITVELIRPKPIE